MGGGDVHDEPAVSMSGPSERAGDRRAGRGGVAPAAGSGHERAPSWRRLTPYAVVLVVAASVYPFIGFLDRNRDEVPQTGRVALYALVMAMLALAVLVAVLVGRHGASADRVAVGVAAGVLSFWSFNVLFSSEPTPDRRVAQLIAWAVLTGLFVTLLYRFSRYGGVRTFVLVLVLVLVAVPLGSYATWRLSGHQATAVAQPVVHEGPPPEPVATPNVYYFVLDEYGRNDQLRAILGYDNTAFHGAMRELGFVVVENSHSPYQQTVMSMASVLDMDYVATRPEEAPDGNMPFANRLRGANATVAYFKGAGYDYVYSGPGVFEWQRCEDAIVDVCIEAASHGFNLSELDLALLDLTPIGSLDLAQERITDPSYALDQLDQRRDEVDEPFFLYSHTLNPHGPYRYDEDCELRDRFVESEYPLPKSELDRRHYVQDVVCLNRLVLDAVERIVEEDPEAIVIVASDHGSKFIPDGYKRLEDWRPEAVREEFGTQFAIRLPERCRDEAEQLVNTVDTFRLVIACLEDRPVDWAEDRAFIWPAEGRGPQEVEDVSVLAPAEGGAGDPS